MSDLGSLRYFLGIDVSSTSDGIYLSQEKYIQNLLDRSSLTDHLTVETPKNLIFIFAPLMVNLSLILLGIAILWGILSIWV